MRTRISTLFLALLIGLTGALTSPLAAQHRTPERPNGTRYTLPDPATVRISAGAVERAYRRVARLAPPSDHLPPARHGLEVPVRLSMETSGTWTPLPDGGRLWRLRIASPGATSINLRYEDFYIPEGARLVLYTDDQRHILGAFTHEDNKPHGRFATSLLPGDATILEYHEPPGVIGYPRIAISTVVHGVVPYGPDHTETPLAASDTYTPKALPCSINEACYDAQWGHTAQSVVRVINGGTSCSGVLLNNAREDGTPYILTAYHCSGSASVNQSVDWVFEFNYQSSTCEDPSQTPGSNTLTGGTVVAAAGGSYDFVLVRLDDPIPDYFDATFAGWSRSESTPQSGAIIGHPKADIKKITIENDPATTYSINWQVEPDHGTVESGSSGSPLFNAQHQVVGILRSARRLDSQSCSGPGGDDNNALVLFPKFSEIWEVGGTGYRLADHLDPDGTGITSLGSLNGGSSGSGSSSGSSTVSVWVNEVNADGNASEDDEFVELVGENGLSLSGYSLEVYSCSGGSATLESSYSLNGFTFGDTYNGYDIFVIGGTGASGTDQSFTSNDVLPNGSGIVVLKDNADAEVFNYQYDDGSDCPSSRTTRSSGDAADNTTMGFTSNTPPDADMLGTSSLSASPGAPNSDGGQLLPVELVAFEAQLDGTAVVLRWETASETNNAGFEIQYRRAEAGSPAWTSTAFVEGHGTTAQPQRYRYRLEELAPGRYRFRLKQLDFDGAFEYGPEVEVAVATPERFVLSPAYPNPFNPQTSFSLAVAQAQHVEVAVYDVLGRQVARLYGGVMEADRAQVFRFDGAELPSGLYIVRVVGERFVASQTVTLMK